MRIRRRQLEKRVLRRDCERRHAIDAVHGLAQAIRATAKKLVASRAAEERNGADSGRKDSIRSCCEHDLLVAMPACKGKSRRSRIDLTIQGCPTFSIHLFYHRVIESVRDKNSRTNIAGHVEAPTIACARATRHIPSWFCQEQAMQTITCVQCGAKFDFDPSTVWNSPGQVTPLPGSPMRIVIQCPRCQHWIKITLQDDSDNESNQTQKGNGGGPRMPEKPEQKR
jgi:hypothetical protein